MRRLVTIPISHFCEKARWALDRAGLAYREERHVQGVHQVASRRAGGTATLPVLVCEDGRARPSPRRSSATPTALGARAAPVHAARAPTRSTASRRWLDAGLGPDGPPLIYAHMLAAQAS